MNWRKPLYSAVLRLKGSVLEYLAEYEKARSASNDLLMSVALFVVVLTELRTRLMLEGENELKLTALEEVCL
jgi:hypothetical protein